MVHRRWDKLPVDMAETKTIPVRMSTDLLAWLDSYVQDFNSKQPGLEINRTDAIRTLLTRALQASDVKPPKRTGK